MFFWSTKDSNKTWETAARGIMGLAVSPLPAAIVVPPRQMVPPKMIGYNQL
jgi:hypothetical protein